MTEPQSPKNTSLHLCVLLGAEPNTLRKADSAMETNAHGTYFQESSMRSLPYALVIPSPVHAHPTQVIGKMSIERRPIAPFRVRCMKRLESESDDMLRKLLHIHLGQQSA